MFQSKEPYSEIIYLRDFVINGLQIKQIRNTLRNGYDKFWEKIWNFYDRFRICFL